MDDNAKGTATVSVTVSSWEEKRVAEVDAAHAVTSVTFAATWAGDAVGQSSTALLICYVEGDPAQPHTMHGPYLGYEQVTGTLAGRTGSFVLAVRGEHAGSVADTRIEVVPDSATGELAGLRGSGSYAADAMTYTLRLDYEFT